MEQAQGGSEDDLAISSMMEQAQGGGEDDLAISSTMELGSGLQAARASSRVGES